MKKIINLIITFFAVTLLGYIPVVADEDDWSTMPVITHVYEVSGGTVYLEWEGDADYYQISVDGKDVKTVKLKNANIPLKAGNHSITIVPIKPVSKDIDTKLELSIANVGSGNIDLAALGLERKDLLRGNQSEPYKLNYTVNPIIKAVPEVTEAYTDADDRVLLTFTDKYDADVYYISIKSGKDVISTEFDTSSEDAASLISKNNSYITVTLDPDFLSSHGWMVPSLDEKYGFSVKLGKWPINYINNEKEPPTVIESENSKFYEYTPYAFWKNAPDITYASQTADGTVTLKWEHDDNGLGCEYKIISPDKFLIVKKGETEIGKTTEKEYTVKDLMNGEYTFSVVPLYGDETGMSSANQTVKVENNWFVAPSLECSLIDGNQVLLQWEALQGVVNYHITVSKSDGSLLKYVNMDYKKIEEIDVPAELGMMEYTYTYDEDTESDGGVKLKFEIYATRKTEKGDDQKSAVSKQIVTAE